MASDFTEVDLLLSNPPMQGRVADRPWRLFILILDSRFIATVKP